MTKFYLLIAVKSFQNMESVILNETLNYFYYRLSSKEENYCFPF